MISFTTLWLRLSSYSSVPVKLPSPSRSGVRGEDAGGRRIALFFTGGQHAGENLADVLAERAMELGPPIQMCDALSRNTSPAFETIVANCLAHGRRRFVDVVDNFPAECRHVLETLGAVYKNEATTKKRSMSPDERLRFHQAESRPGVCFRRLCSS